MTNRCWPGTTAMRISFDAVRLGVQLAGTLVGQTIDTSRPKPAGGVLRERTFVGAQTVAYKVTPTLRST